MSRDDKSLTASSKKKIDEEADDDCADSGACGSAALDLFSEFMKLKN